MPKRLAITISGAVSLGSYEAGVLYELLEALRQHNTDPATGDEERIRIDVLTGASAGGMTAAIAAQKLLYEGNSLSKYEDNPFYRPWVVDVSLARLLALDDSEDPSHSLFSSDLIEQLSANYLTKRYRSHIPLSAGDRVPHAAAADHIYLGLAMSNLNGVDYQQTLRTGGAFTYTRYLDRLALDFKADGSDGRDSQDPWEFIRSGAVACGAFPFAFRTHDIFRHRSEYPDTATFSTPTELFTYTDGGVFQNEPLGMAKDFVDLIDNHRDTETRFYLFVDPGSRDGTTNPDFHEADANLWGTAKELVNSLFNQARFHDWIAAEQVNEKIRLFNERAVELCATLQNGTVAAGDLQPAATALLSVLFADPATRKVESDRLTAQFAGEFAALQNLNPPAGQAYIDSLLVLETAAQLGPKDEMNIYGITASNAELAGFDLAAFAGFFDQRYRQHDYNVGRAKARDFLTNTAALGPLGPIRWHPQSEIAIDRDLDDLRLADMDKVTRQELRDRFHDRANEILKELGIRGFGLGDVERGIVMNVVVNPLLDKFLSL